MKGSFWFYILIQISQFSAASQTTAIEYAQQANVYYDAKQYDECAKSFEQAAQMNPNNYNAYYGASCCKALAGDKGAAFFYLDKAIEHGWRDTAWMATDVDLQTLREGAEWSNRITKIRELLYVEEKRMNIPYKETLLNILYDDQRYRSMMDSVSRNYGWESTQIKELGLKIRYTDSININKLVNLIEKYGWPTKLAVGDRACTSVFLVIQHADIAVQEKYFPMIENAVKNGDLDKESYALLVDRIRMKKGFKQLYGSQLQRNTSGNFELFPIEDEANVNKRRQEMGMQPIEEYVKRWNIIYQPKK